MKLLVVRHAQPHDEADTGGEGDPPLSDLGLRQAQAIGDFLQHEGVDHVVSSPMVRAQQTAEPLCAHLGLTPELDDDLKEAGWQLGAYMRSEENMQHYIDRIKDDPEYLYRPEGRDLFGERVQRSFRSIVTNNPGRTVAVFCHGMVKSSLLAMVLGVTPEPGALSPTYSGLSRVEASSKGDMWSLRSFNESMHLPRD
jgi:probable phosphoglycerate mutase